MTAKKLTSTIVAFLFFGFNAIQVQAGTIDVGITASLNDLDTLGTEDVGQNGTITTTKTFSDTIGAGSIFAETTMEFGSSLALTIGVDYIPMSADISKRTTSQASITTAGTATTGTNSVQGEVQNHKTIYIQPGYMSGSNLFYGTLGLSHADLEGELESISSTNIVESKRLLGTKIGVGVKHVRDSGMFVKADYSQTDYDPVSWVTSSGTKGTAELENTQLAISIGKQF